MAEYVTTKCCNLGHPEIGFAVADKSELSADWLIAYFESEIEMGRKFRAGETVQIGWLIVQLRQGSGNTLELWEPDFDSMPIKWCRGINNTLRHLILQQSICTEIGSAPVFPSLRQSGIVSPAFIHTPDDFLMYRDQPTNGDSGWAFKSVIDNGREGTFMSLFEVALSHMEIIPFLALPPGASVAKHSGLLKLEFAHKRISSQTNAVLRKVAETRFFV